MRFSLATGSALLCMSMIALISPAQAQTQRFEVSPMVTITRMRNSQAKGAITITNSGKEPLRVRVYAEDFTYDRQGFVSTTSHPQSAISYLQFAPRELVVPPGVTRNVRIGATLPSSLPDGEYRAVIFLEDLKEQKILTGANNRSVNVKVRIASVFYFNKGVINSEPKVNGAIWDPSKREIKMLVANTGKTTAYPDIEWRLERDGKVVAKDQISGFLLQSGVERELSLDLGGKPLTPGNYSIVGNIIDSNIDTGSNRRLIPFNIKVTVP
jgi:hypothetical protein